MADVGSLGSGGVHSGNTAKVAEDDAECKPAAQAASVVARQMTSADDLPTRTKATIRSAADAAGLDSVGRGDNVEVGVLYQGSGSVVDIAVHDDGVRWPKR